MDKKNNTITIVSIGDICEMNETRMETKRNIYNAEYGKSLKKEDFKEILEAINEEKYEIHFEDIAYFDKKENAYKVVDENRADMYECGTYPYVMVKTVKKDCMYANFSHVTDIRFYCFDIKDKLTYVDVTEDIKKDPILKKRLIPFNLQ